MKIPQIILNAHRALPWDERDLFWEINVGDGLGITNTHIDRGSRGMVVAQTPPGTNVPLVRVYAASAPPDPVAQRLPGFGQRVWVIKDRRISHVETMRVANIIQFGDFYNCSVVADGPLPGTPTPGESGSVAWTVENGRAVLLGHLNYAGLISLPFWHQRLSAGAVVIAARPGTPAWPADVSNDWFFGSPAIELVNRHDVRLEGVPFDPAARFVVRGDKTDQWEHPRRDPYWPVTAIYEDGGWSLSWEVSQTSGGYTLEATVSSKQTFGPFEPGATLTPGTVPVTDGERVKELEAAVNELTTANEVLKNELESSRADLAETAARLESVRNAVAALRNA